MSGALDVIASPDPAIIAAIAALAPDNPFLTPAYASAWRSLGESVFALRPSATHESAPGTLAFVRRGWRGASLRIDSVPPWPGSSPAWPAVLEFCRTQAIDRVKLGSFGSLVADVPPLEGETCRRRRWEYLLALRNDLPDLSDQHKRNVARAHRAGLRHVQSRDPAGCRAHAELVEASLRRHRARGEPAPGAAHLASLEALILSGAAEVHEARLGDATAASVLVLRAERGGYYHSAGSSEVGRECGAAAFLVLQVARALRQDGADSFNLGGAGATESGLRRFKSGFGTVEYPLQAVSCEIPLPLARRAIGLWRRLLQT